jgi:hypothetical protein
VPLGDLAAATNELTRIFVHHELRSEDFRDATGIACKALNGLYNDPDFDDAFLSLQNVAEQEAEHVGAIIDDVEHFTEHFLRRELKMLEQEFHIDPLMLRALRTAAHELRTAVRAEHPSFLQLKQRVGSLRDEACAISAGVKDVLDGPSRRKRLLRYALTGVGGVVMIANHSPIGLSYFSPAGAGSSWKLGIGLVGVGSTSLYIKVLEKIGTALGL